MYPPKRQSEGSEALTASVPTLANAQHIPEPVVAASSAAEDHVEEPRHRLGDGVDAVVLIQGVNPSDVAHWNSLR